MARQAGLGGIEHPNASRACGYDKLGQFLAWALTVIFLGGTAIAFGAISGAGLPYPAGTWQQTEACLMNESSVRPGNLCVWNKLQRLFAIA